MKTHIFVAAENYSAAQTISNTYETKGLALVDWHPSPRGGLILHFAKAAKPQNRKPAQSS